MTYWKLKWRNEYGFPRIHYFENFLDAADWYHHFTACGQNIGPPVPVDAFDLIRGGQNS